MLKIESFEQLSIRPELLKAIQKMGFTAPTPVQAESIPILLQNGINFIGLAQTGTGKTAAYGLPLLNKLDLKQAAAQALILCPTRELCLQVAEELKKFSCYLDGVSITPIYGGVSIQKQIQALSKGTHVVVATPGRLLDHLHHNKINLSSIRYVVLDEADKMLEMGFCEDVDQILAHMPQHRSIWLFSATMPQEIREIASRYMPQAVEVCIGEQNVAAENVVHHYYVCLPADRFDTLERIIDSVPSIYAIIFTRTKVEAQDTAEALIKNGYNADALHGDLGQEQRDRVMKMFREKTLQLLVATDVAARGLDVCDLTHVINYGLPDDTETYIHRAGRTARAGKSGIAVSIITPQEQKVLWAIEKGIKKKFERKLIPTAEEVIETRFLHFIKQVQETEYDEARLNQFLPTFTEQLKSFSREELLKRFCWQALRRFINVSADKKDLNKVPLIEKVGRYQRFFINLGTKDGFHKKSELLAWLSASTGLKVSHIHRLEIFQTYSFFESFIEEAPIILQQLSGLTYNRRKVVVELAQSKDKKQTKKSSKKTKSSLTNATIKVAPPEKQRPSKKKKNRKK
ncbi:MAG: DEAD/DEAH box helicase [Bacteroidia bacterium]|nr:DEAD/DEAH box helicase [Bacteroidia bacterium]MDW8159241.1 DEAD/DEAH box helicase [Bacteroidia bacterium]